MDFLGLNYSLNKGFFVSFFSESIIKYCASISNDVSSKNLIKSTNLNHRESWLAFRSGSS